MELPVDQTELEDDIARADTVNFYRLVTFIVDIGLGVIHEYIRVKLLNGETFENFLNTHKHILFHIYEVTNCCMCSSKISYTKLLSREQFYLLYKKDKTKLDKSHVQNHQICICSVTAKANIKVEVVDITLASYIIQKCGIIDDGKPGIEVWMEYLRETRNIVFHTSDAKQITSNEFKKHWQTISGCVKGIWNLVHSEDQMQLQEKIDKLEKLVLVPDRVFKYRRFCHDFWKSKCAEFEQLRQNSRRKVFTQLHDAVSEDESGIQELLEKIESLNSKVERILISISGNNVMRQMIDSSNLEKEEENKETKETDDSSHVTVFSSASGMSNPASAMQETVIYNRVEGIPDSLTNAEPLKIVPHETNLLQHGPGTDCGVNRNDVIRTNQEILENDLTQGYRTVPVLFQMEVPISWNTARICDVIEQMRLNVTPDMKIKVKDISTEELTIFTEVMKSLLTDFTSFKSEIKSMFTAVLEKAEVDTSKEAVLNIHIETPTVPDESSHVTAFPSTSGMSNPASAMQETVIYNRVEVIPDSLTNAELLKIVPHDTNLHQHGTDCGVNQNDMIRTNQEILGNVFTQDQTNHTFGKNCSGCTVEPSVYLCAECKSSVCDECQVSHLNMKHHLQHLRDTYKYNYSISLSLNYTGIVDLKAVSDELFVITEESNHDLILYNDSQKCKQTIDMGGEPFAVCIIDDGIVAVTVPAEKTVRLVDIRNTCVKENIAVKQMCFGIMISDYYLFVGCDRKITICGIFEKELNEDRKLKQIGNAEQNLDLEIKVPSIPHRLVWTDETNIHYINHHKLCNMTKGVVTLNRRYQEWHPDFDSFQHIEGPSGISKDNNGNILVLCEISGKLFKISSNESDSEVCINQVPIGQFPFPSNAISYHSGTKSVFIGSGSTIHVYTQL